ncbi:MAG TPA: ABC transporter ATP-binding protein [Roseiarcus sp.]|jgi:ABC-2 type transport system ATP-binding protein|nr:ABC transporter ATP-binding protein [Roseiarcus sp.]
MSSVLAAQSKTAVSALSVDNVSHAYGARIALAEVSFTVAPASFTVLLGLNGAGKSTLFSVITHLYASRSGAVRIFGRDVACESGAALSLLGVLFQQRTLDPDLTVGQNLAYHGALHGIRPRESRARAAGELARVGLADRVHDKVRYLSGGQMRRVEIARALLHRPRMLLLDEPTAGLDIKARADLLEVVRGLVADEGIGVLWTTHLVDEIRDDDHVVVLHRGRVLADDASGSVVRAAGAGSIGEAFRRLTGPVQEEGES